MTPTVAVLLALAPVALSAPGYIQWTKGGFVAPDFTQPQTHGGPFLQSGNAVRVLAGPATTANAWTYAERTNTTIETADRGVRYCLDAGLAPADGTRLKIWQCFDGAPQQTWFFADDHVELAGVHDGKILCADVPDGDPGKGYLQLWTCTAGQNQNQVFSKFCGSRGAGPYPSGPA